MSVSQTDTWKTTTAQPETWMAATECQDCIDACLQCHTICVETALHCLQKIPNDAGLVRMLLDCAEVCQTNAALLQAGADLQEANCMVCGIVYEQFARECTKLSSDPQLQRCADAIYLCIERCEQLIMAA